MDGHDDIDESDGSNDYEYHFNPLIIDTLETNGTFYGTNACMCARDAMLQLDYFHCGSCRPKNRCHSSDVGIEFYYGLEYIAGGMGEHKGVEKRNGKWYFRAGALDWGKDEFFGLSTSL